MDIFDFYRDPEKKAELLSILDLGTQKLKENLSAQFLEKDLWVTEVLRILFDESLFGSHAVAFKGGTALSKKWNAIHRFSEDIDLSIHWHDLYPEKGEETKDEAKDWEVTTASNSQAKKFRSEQSERLLDFTKQIAKDLQVKFDAYGIDGISVELDEKSNGEQIKIKFPSVTNTEEQYHLDYVLLEFGARNRGKPTQPTPLTTYLSTVPELSEISFPVANQVTVFESSYIIWEKLTALHQFCTQEKCPNAARLARHWYDVDCMINLDIVKPVNETQARDDVIAMKSNRWKVTGVDFSLAAAGGLQIIPQGDFLQELENDHDAMVKSNMFYQIPDDFPQILERLKALETEINDAYSQSQ